MKTIKYQKFFEDVISDFPKRSQEIIRMRFGVGFPKSYTLEHIGSKYGVTRERVRQIIKSVITRVSKQLKENSANQVVKDILFTLEKNNGIMKEEEALMLIAGKSAMARSVVAFFAACSEEVVIRKEDNEFEQSWSRKDFDSKKWKTVISAAKEIFENGKKTFTDKEIVSEIKNKIKNVKDQELLNWLAVSTKIKKNVFSKWGLANWPEINPKGMRQKAYLVLKENGSALHFRKIAGMIDKHLMSKRKAHPQTVHNELIKDDRFVLVGRGIYALSEWGYHPGTVKEVIREIMTKKTVPLTKEEIINEVLKLRKVRKTTILVNLNNAKLFKKFGEHQYSLKK